MPKQQVIVGVCSRFGRIVSGTSAQSYSRLNNAVHQVAPVTDKQVSARTQICGKISFLHCAMPASDNLRVLMTLQFIVYNLDAITV